MIYNLSYRVKYLVNNVAKATRRLSANAVRRAVANVVLEFIVVQDEAIGLNKRHNLVA